MEQLRFWAEWLDNDSQRYKIRIIDTDATSPFTAKEITVSEVNLTNKSVDKFTSLLSSALEMTILSESNYQFFDIYTVDQYKYKVNIYTVRNDVDYLLWSGYIDPEIYEEPYNYVENYFVKITATNFGSLNRAIYDIRERITSIFDLLKICISASKIDFNNLYICDSIKLNVSDSNSVFENLFIYSNNFIDKSYYDIISDVLFAFGMQLNYHNGDMYIYDYDTIAKTEASYHKYSNTYSYISSTVINHDIGPIDILGCDANILIQPTFQTAQLACKINADPRVTSATIGDEFAGYVKEETIMRNWHSDNVGFKAKYYKEVKNGSLLYTYSTNSGYMNGLCMSVENYYSEAFDGFRCFTPSEFTYFKIVSTEPKFLNVNINSDCQLRIKTSVLLSVSYNPFEPVGLSNEEGANKRLQKNSNMIYFNADLLLLDDNDNVIYYYENMAKKYAPALGWRRMEEYIGESVGWVKVTDGKYDKRAFALSYYTANTRSASPAGGVMTNSYDRNPLTWSRSPSLIESEYNGQGTIVSCPPVQGRLQLVLYTGFKCFKKGKNSLEQHYEEFRWLVFKDIEIKVESKQKGKEYDDNDIIYDCVVNSKAKDSFERSLIIGTNVDKNPMAKFSIMKKSGEGYTYCHNLIKNGKSEIVEQHLISSLFSNFSTKQIQIDTSAKAQNKYGYYTENGKKMFKIYSKIDLCRNTEDIKLIEFKESNMEVEVYD